MRVSAILFSDSAKGDSLFWSTDSESASFHPKDSKALPVQAYYDNNHRLIKWKAARPLNKSKPMYAALAKGSEALYWYYRAAGQKPPLDSSSGTTLLIAEEQGGRLVFLQPTIHPIMKVNYLTAVYQSSAGLYLLGKLTQNDGEHWKEAIWVGQLVNGRLNERVFLFPQNAAAYVLSVDPKTTDVFIAGDADYSQAITGSVGHTKAFILWLDSNLTEWGRHLLRGPGSTHINYLSVDSSGRHLVTAGSTNSSSTHDKRIAETFIQTLSLDEIKGDKK